MLDDDDDDDNDEPTKLESVVFTLILLGATALALFVFHVMSSYL